MTRKFYLADSLLMAAVMVAAGLLAQAHVAAAEEDEPNGRIVQIGPANGNEDLPVAEEQPARPAEVAYWIGISGRNIDSDVLRTHLQLAEDTGVVIEEVVADSPAAKAGLKRHDIVLRANGEMVDSMEMLQDIVSKSKDKPIDLQLLRLGKETDVTVTPEQRPEKYSQANQSPDTFAFDPFGGNEANQFGQLFQQFRGGAGLPGGVRVFGPGMVFNSNRFDFSSLPNGMSVSIQRENDGPAKITVKKGEETWTLSSDDTEALKKLPEDVRKYVQGMMDGGIDIRKEFGNFDWQAELQQMLPDGLGKLPTMEGFQQQENRVMKRMEDLEKRIEELQQRLNQNQNESNQNEPEK